MDYTDKIHIFPTIEELKEEISQDRESKDFLSQRYGVRFIMFNNFADYKHIYTFISKDLHVNTLQIEDLAYGDDKTITSETLITAIKEQKDSVILAPFSELVRFYDNGKFNGFFSDIILHEDTRNPQKRIYIPIIGLHNRFTDFLKNFGRIAESAPIWQYYSTDDQVLVYVAHFDAKKLPSKMGVKTINTMRDWLRFWKTIAPVDKILCNARPIKSSYKNSRPDSIFTFNPICNAYQFITEFLEVVVPIQYKEADEKYWEQLLGVLYDTNIVGFSLEALVKIRFNKVHVNINTYFELWANADSDFDRWLLKNYGFSSALLENNPYLRTCIDETSKLTIPNELFGNIAARIFHLFSPAEQAYHATERYELISQNAKLFNRLVPEEIKSNIQNDLILMVSHDNNFYNAKKLLTGVFDFEHLLTLGWYVVRNNESFTLRDVQKFYPELYAYLQPTNISNIDKKLYWLISYLQDYKIAKISDKYTENIAKTIKNKNGSPTDFYGWFFLLDDEHDLLQEAFNSKSIDTVYWIDGLGAEYIPYIEWVLATTTSCEYKVVQSCLAKTGVPSSTSLNFFPVDNKTIFKIGELDAFAHNAIYKKYKSVSSELDVVRDIITKIINDNSGTFHNIAIVSDHGLTSLSRLVESKKLSKETEHEGRYIKLDKGIYVDDVDFIVQENNGDKYKVALNHVSLGKKPIREVHGGCTPEEVVVPFMIISNNPSNHKIDYKVRLIKEEVPISTPIIELDISPTPDEILVEINGCKQKMSKGRYWSFNIENATEGVCDFRITPTNGNPISMKINIYEFGSTTNPFEEF